MIFKHEFLVPLDTADIERSVKSHKDRCAYELGKKIGEIFCWEEVEKPPHLHLEDTRYKLEIIAFTMKDWLMFRQRLNHFFPNRDLDTILHDLEYGPVNP